MMFIKIPLTQAIKHCLYTSTLKSHLTCRKKIINYRQNNLLENLMRDLTT